MKEIYAIIVMMMCVNMASAQCCGSDATVLNTNAYFIKNDLMMGSKAVSRISIQHIVLPQMVSIMDENNLVVSEEKMNEIWKYQAEVSYVVTNKWQLNGFFPVLTVDPIFGTNMTSVSDIVFSSNFTLLDKMLCDTTIVKPTWLIYSGLKVPTGKRVTVSQHNNLGNVHTGSWDVEVGTNLNLQRNQFGMHSGLSYTVRGNDYNAVRQSNILQWSSLLNYQFKHKNWHIVFGTGINGSILEQNENSEITNNSKHISSYYWNALLQATLNRWVVSLVANNKLNQPYKDETLLNNQFQKLTISYIL